MDHCLLSEAQWLVLVKGLKSSYVSHNLLSTDEAVKIWYNMLKDIPYNVLNAAVMRWISTEHFPPTIADLRSMSIKVTAPELHDWTEAWQLTKKAIQMYGYYRQEEGLASLPDDVRAAVERIGWKEMCLADLDQESINRAQFRDCYNTIADRKSEAAALSDRVKNMISEITRGLLDV